MGLEVFKTRECSWDGLAFTLYLDQPLKQVELENGLRELIEAWFLVGLYGGFGGYFHHMSSIGFDENLVEWQVDMGSSSTQALDVLINCLETFERDNDVTMEKLVLGLETVE